MDYKDIRQKFVEFSGRYDLVKPTWEDNGADFFLNAGQKFLDRSMSNGKMKARYTASLAAGTIVIYTTLVRSIQEVWVSNSAGMYELKRETINGIRNYYEKKLSDVDRGTPAYYAPGVFRPAPDTTVAADVAGFYDIEDLILHVVSGNTGHWTYNGILLMPPPDVAFTISLWGLFYSPALSATLAGSTWTQTKSVWTECYADTLLYAALYKLETMYRNTEGAKDWKDAMLADVDGLDKDAVEDDLEGGASIEMEVKSCL